MEKLNDANISSIIPLMTPESLKNEFPVSDQLKEQIISYRKEVKDILEKKDDRMLAIVGPCSIHDPKAAMEYAERLLELRERYKDRLCIIMRVYFEKPRTALGWRGLILDPDLDGSYKLEKGLRQARKLLLDINAMGLPAGSEILDPIVPQYISDLVSWAAIGARTTESQTHRELTSGLSMPVGFKNGTDGSMDVAINGIKSALHPHSFIGIDKQGQTCVLNTKGNKTGHPILRGGKNGPNYYEEIIEDTEELLIKEGLQPTVIIDCSHENSGKKYFRQERVMNSIMDQRRRGRSSIAGFMLESNLHEGKQAIPEDKSLLEYGISITDACISFNTTSELLYSAYKVLKGH
ncbi:MAG: 3-deoxy-7-phosphoheptulonate synthase [Spirochaetales bacterium]|nr:3-deoxy-7-phosphoheptulonate synthase [Spirochaetales bacterium]